MQAHGITLSFHREMADSSRELGGPDVTDAVNFESYPRFIKGGFQDYEGLGIKRSTADSKHVPSPTIEVGRKQRVLSLPQKVVEFLELAALRAIIPNGGDRASRDLGGTPRPEFQSGGGVLASLVRRPNGR